MAGQPTFADMMQQDEAARLPIFDVLLDIQNALADQSNLVVIAPPGAGKTTIVPLALIDASWRKDRKILVLEPRRLAARGAAHRMASLLGETVGERVGYRVRFDTKVSDQTIVEVVTEGVFTRMLVNDPSLENVACVLFDEFHERSLDGDVALALCLDLQSGLREDLRLVPMSATIDGGGVAKLLNSQMVESKGRSYPVEIEYVPRKPDVRLEPFMTSTILDVVKQKTPRGVLVFLPGQAEILRVAALLKERDLTEVNVNLLYGALPHKEQQQAVKPIKSDECRIILATDIAETSLTIDGVDCVIDSGVSRQPRYEPATGFTRLETQKISLASADQRAGRAGRTGPGYALRLWNKGQNAALAKHSTPEILNTDLSGFVLNLLDWGVNDVAQLNWMDIPPAPLLAEAKRLLKRVDAVDKAGKITKHGRLLNTLAFSPRLAHMIVTSAQAGDALSQRAALLALLLQERGLGGNAADLDERLRQCASGNDPRTKQLVKLAKRISQSLVKAETQNNTENSSTGALLARAFPDRVAMKMSSTGDGATRYKLANGTGVEIETNSSLAGEMFLVVADTVGRAGKARITSSAAISKSEIEAIFQNDIFEEVVADFDIARKEFTARKIEKLGHISLSKPRSVQPDEVVVLKALTEAVRKHGTEILPWSKEDISLQNRLMLLHEVEGDTWPNVSEPVLIEHLDQWLVPFLGGQKNFEALGKGALTDGLLLLANHPSREVLEQLVPTQFKAPSGSVVPIEYRQSQAVIAIRPQELFGLDEHPTILNGKTPVSIELLSPAGRPIQITKDLPGFWRGTWKDVRADLRGRYPKHPWPEDPLDEPPTNRTKPRK
jgi:ATP-dependent helicase HrpB